MAQLFSPISWLNYWKNLRHYMIALLIFLVGLFISLSAFRSYQITDHNHAHAEFDRLADLRLFLMKDLLLDTLREMRSIKQFYYASSHVSKEEFAIFVKNIFKHYPNYLALGYVDKFSEASPPSSEGLTFVNVTKNGLEKFEFFPFTYLEKSTLHPRFSIDSKAYPIFLNTLQESQNNQEVLASNQIIFFEETKKEGFFLFSSISKKQNFDEKNLEGTIVGFSNFENIIKNIRSQIQPIGINMGIYDVSNEKENLLYWNAAIALKDPPTLTLQQKNLRDQWKRSLTFKFGNQTWKLEATPTLEFIRKHENQGWPHWEIPIIGILISALTASSFLNLVNRRLIIEQEVQDRTNELANINYILQQEIHERQRIEESMMIKQDYLQRRHEALKYLTTLRILELHHAMQEVTLRTAVVMQVSRVVVWFYETVDHNEILSCISLYNSSTNSFSDQLEISTTHFPRYFQALSKRSYLILPSPEDGELNQEISSYLAAFHITSKLDIPIVFEGNLLGLLSCEETRGHRDWILEDRHFGQTIADIIAIMIEQSARRKAEKAFKESEEQLRFITQTSMDGIVTVNEKKEVISWNYGAQQMFGYKENEIVGKPLKAIIPQEESLRQIEISTKPIELKGRHRDNHFFPIEITQTPWKIEQMYFDTMIIRDITERKQYEKRLIKAMHEAHAANAAKSEFLATISHELRTPLNAIIGFNECLLLGMDGPINSAQQESLKKIEKSSFHLFNLINDILDWSKIEAKKMKLELSVQNIVEIIHSSIEEMQSLAKQKNLNIYLSVDEPFILVEIDAIRIRQVLLNLLSNAIKFTEKGFIKVTLIDQPRQVSIEITDTGIGLSPEEIEKIFHPFSQADSSITRKYGGTGLGLVISKNIIHLHGGSITVSSQKGKGSTFTVTLSKLEQ